MREVCIATVQLPCSAAQLEEVLLRVSHQGHWHDAQVRVENEQLKIVHPEDDPE